VSETTRRRVPTAERSPLGGARAHWAQATWQTTVQVAPIAILILAATGLRFLLLGSRELFRDEAASWMLAQAPWSEIGRRSAAEPYAPVYPFVLKAWMTLVGDSAAAMRALSAAFGMGVVAVTWAWARQALGGRTALIAGVLVALSPLAIGNARDIRMYAMETLAITLSWWLIWRLLVDTRPLAKRPAGIALAGAAVAAELWILPTGIGAFLLQAAVVCGLLVMAPGSGARAGAVALAGGMAAFLPGITRLLAEAGGAQPFWTPTPNLGDLPETFVVAFGGGLISPAWLATLPLAGLAVVGLRRLFGRGREALPTALCIAAGAALILEWWTISLWRSAYDTRYLAAAVPPLALAIAAGWQRVAVRASHASVIARRATMATGVALLLLIASGTGSFLADWLSSTGLAPAQAAVQFLRERVEPGDVVLVADARSYLPIAYQLDREADPIPLSAPVRYWRSGNEPAFVGGDLVAADRTVGPNDSLAPGVLPGLTATGSIWLVALTNPNGELEAFTPLHDGRVVEVERTQVADNGVSGWIVRLRPTA
jgi:mannosyltransferase